MILNTANRGNLVKLKKTIVLKGTMACNLRCQYCYEFRQHGDVVSGEKLSSENVAQIINRCARLFPESQILWLLHGGEPLIKGVDFFESIAQSIRDANQDYGVHYRLALQTNGTLLSDEWIGAFNRNLDVFGERIISISIDGPEDLEGKVRVNAAGDPIHADIMSRINKIRASNLDFTTISVVGQHNVHEPEKVYRFIQSLNPNFAKFIPCYNLDEFGNVEHLGITPLEYASFMCNIFDLWLRDLPHKTDERFVIDPILSITSKITDTPVTWCEYQTKKCDNFVSMYPDGDLWLCDAYDHRTMKNEAFVGNIFSLSDRELKQALETPDEVCSYQTLFNSMMDECQDCDIYSYCCGGCLEKRMSMKLKSEQRHSEFCEGKKMLINHIRGAVDSALS
jgi:uncharacterized protein